MQAIGQAALEDERFYAAAELLAASCAAQIVRRMRASLHRAGAFEVTVGVGVTEPPWFQLGLRFMQRSGRWAITHATQACGAAYYRAVWLRWPRSQRTARHAFVDAGEGKGSGSA